VKGSEQFAYDWLGVTWQFASAEHRETFAATPIRYAPQYGGFCTSSVAANEIFNIDPEAWRIVNSKLYLFGTKAGLEEEWDPNPAAVMAKADANWPALEAKLIAR
jgi:YHS domain-containing protein